MRADERGGRRAMNGPHRARTAPAGHAEPKARPAFRGHDYAARPDQPGRALYRERERARIALLT